jgi:serine/threonine-protein kinase
MPASVTFTITSGPSRGKQFVFTERTTAIIGRDKECTVRFPKDRDHQSISRHHCLLDINPPDVSIRDLGSRSGTYVNGELIGKREKDQDAEQGSQLQFAEFMLNDGDEIKLGTTILRLHLQIATVCVECATEIAADQRTRSLLPGGGYRCAQCQARSEMVALPAQTASWRVCLQCGRDVTAEMGQTRPGEVVCQHCRSNPQQVAQRLVDLAQTGTRDLVSIQGYRIERELGRGGMGAVYLATHEPTGQPRALKVMLPQVAANRYMRDLFLREASVTRALNHPHVVRLHDLGCCNGTFFFSMDYCDGGSVADLLKQRHQPLPPAQAVPLILQALDGLAYAHQVPVPEVQLADGRLSSARGLVHRDIKPQNIFLTRVGNQIQARLGDYGLAKAFDLAGLSGLSVTGTTAGTPVFMPRQQLIDFKYARPEVDVWATAATLYYMLTLEFPRHFPAATDPWQVVLQNNAVPILQRNPALPPNLARVIDAALVDNPDIQIKLAVELQTALRAACR